MAKCILCESKLKYDEDPKIIINEYNSTYEYNCTSNCGMYRIDECVLLNMKTGFITKNDVHKKLIKYRDECGFDNVALIKMNEDFCIKIETGNYIVGKYRG